MYAAWRPTELAQGHPSLAVTFRQLDQCVPGGGFEALAHRQIELAVTALRANRNAATGLISGLAGLAFAADFVDRRAYAQLLSTLDGLIARRTEAIMKRIDARDDGVADLDIDVVSGLTGIGAYHLARANEDALRPILDRLVRLSSAAGPVPAWHIPPDLLRDEEIHREYPLGQLNYGLAHGLPGPLALLALSCFAGVQTNGLAEAIEHASFWLVDHAVEDEWGTNWPGLVAVGADPKAQRPTRGAWCYGAPGIARALWLAGVALNDRELQATAVAALEAVHRRPPEMLRADSPTFCHGAAGLLQITCRMANDSGSTDLQAAADRLGGELLERFEAESILGFRDVEPDGRRVDQAGLLQGAAGIALVLLAAAVPVPPRWDRVFLLS